jgi:hypothetical protein
MFYFIIFLILITSRENFQICLSYYHCIKNTNIWELNTLMTQKDSKIEST